MNFSSSVTVIIVIFLLGASIFCLLYFEMDVPYRGLVWLFSCRNFFRIRQEFLNIVFAKVPWGTYMLLSFQVKFENVLIYFLYRLHLFTLCEFDLVVSGLILSKGIDSDTIKPCFVKFYHSCLNFSDLKCGTCVFREPN